MEELDARHAGCIRTACRRGAALGWPASSEVAAGKQAKSLQSQPALKDLRLPKDLVAFLKAGKQLKFNAAKSEVGPIQLKSIEELTLDTLEMQTEGTPAHAHDPNRRKRGHYTTRAVDLVAECDAYGPEGILAWLIDDRVFGQWDPDHMQVIIFPRQPGQTSQPGRPDTSMHSGMNLESSHSTLSPGNMGCFRQSHSSHSLAAFQQPRRGLSLR